MTPSRDEERAKKAADLVTKLNCQLEFGDCVAIIAQALADARREAFNEAAKICDDYAEDRWSAYKGRGDYKNSIDRANDLTQGASICAEHLAAAIRRAGGE